jgi:hypothetical protein
MKRDKKIRCLNCYEPIHQGDIPAEWIKIQIHNNSKQTTKKTVYLCKSCQQEVLSVLFDKSDKFFNEYYHWKNYSYQKELESANKLADKIIEKLEKDPTQLSESVLSRAGITQQDVDRFVKTATGLSEECRIEMVQELIIIENWPNMEGRIRNLLVKATEIFESDDDELTDQDIISDQESSRINEEEAERQIERDSYIQDAEYEERQAEKARQEFYSENLEDYR